MTFAHRHHIFPFPDLRKIRATLQGMSYTGKVPGAS